MKKQDDMHTMADVIWERHLRQQVLQKAIRATHVEGTIPSGEVFDLFKRITDEFSHEELDHILPKWLGGSGKTIPLHSDPRYKKWLKKAMLLRITK